jgi:hypothetical protein
MRGLDLHLDSDLQGKALAQWNSILRKLELDNGCEIDIYWGITGRFNIPTLLRRSQQIP